MFYTALALVMTVLMGGIIAYNGDLIGRKFGKRRVSLLGMRPKHTAILITSVTGIVISGMTTGAMFLLVPQVREVILEGEQAIREKYKLEKQNKGLRGEIVSLESRRQASAANAIKEAERAARARRDLVQAESHLSTALVRARDAESRMRTAEARRREAIAATERQRAQNHTLMARNENLRGINETLGTINKELANSNFALTQQKTELEGTNRRLAVEIEARQKQVADLAAKNQQYIKENSEVAAQNESLTRQNSTLLGTNRRLLDDNYRLDDQNRDLTQRNRQLSERVTRIEKDTGIELATLYRRYRAMKTRPLAIRAGEDLARLVVPANATPEQARAVIEQLMRDANEAAQAKGAGNPESSSPRVVQVVSKQVLTSTQDGRPVAVEVTESDRTQAMINRLTDSVTPVCVLAVAVENSVEGEPAAIDFQPFNDRLIYPKGRTVSAPRRMNAANSPARIFSELVSYLKDLGQSAVEHGMIPRIDPSTGVPQVGALDWPELVDLADRIRAFGRFVKITATAASDTKASDALKLDFRIDPSL